MYKKTFFRVVTLFSVLTASGQNYDAYVSQANNLYENNRYDASAKAWKEAFEIQKGYASDYYNAACTFSLAGKPDEAIDHLKEAIRVGWSDIEWLKNDGDLAPLHGSEAWENLLEEIPELQKSYLKSINVGMKNELEKLRLEDQTIRFMLSDVEERFGRDSEEYKWFRHELMPRNDNLVLEKVINFIDENGWVGINEVGEDANQTLWLIIQHAPLEIQEKYLPILKKSVDEGESKASYFAFLTDRILMRKGEKQIYGTQSLWNPEKQKNVIYPIEDYKTVNTRRANVGLGTIEDYADSNGFLYEPENNN